MGNEPKPTFEGGESGVLQADLGLAFDGAYDAMFVVDLASERILDANAEACRMLGYRREELRGLPMRTLHPRDMPKVRAFSEQVWQCGRARKDGLSCRTRDGSFIPVEISASTFELQGRSCLLILAHDMRAHEESERRLLVAKQAAEEADRAKSTFLANVSHEFRTPLNAIIGFSEALAREAYGPLGDERYRDYVEGIHASGLHLHALVSDLLDLARIESGRFRLEEAEVDLAQIFDACVVMLREQSDASALSVEIGPGRPSLRLRADPCALRQIVLNLLTNAAKFAIPGGQVRLGAGEDGDGRITITIEDDGPGIPADELERVMKPFDQGSARPSRGRSGVGLGLPLARHLAELHGGTLALESPAAGGTVATVTLPAARNLRAT